MGINRAALKFDARDRIGKYRPSPILVGLVFCLLAWVLSGLESGVLGVNSVLKGYYNILSADYASDAAFYDALGRFAENSRPGAIASLLALALAIMNRMVSAGFTIYALHVSRGERADYGNLFDGFGLFFRLLWLWILEGIFVLLWSLLLYVPGIVAAYRYRQAVYLLLDHPDWSAMDCIRGSKELMRAHKWELFVLDLSFLGWALLVAFIPPVSVWVTPYQEITLANYYNALLGPGGARPGGPRIYEGQFRDIPDDER